MNPDHRTTAAAEAMEDAAMRWLGRDLGTIHRDGIAAAALAAADEADRAAGWTRIKLDDRQRDAIAHYSDEDPAVTDARLAHRIEGGHWMVFDYRRQVVGCHCGFRCDVDLDWGFGDSFLDHFEALVRAECVAAAPGMGDQR